MSAEPGLSVLLSIYLSLSLSLSLSISLSLYLSIYLSDYLSSFLYIYVVNAVLLKVRSNLYQSRYNLSAMNIKQDRIHTATIPWTINATTTGCNLVYYVNQTIVIYWSMSQTGHDPLGYNPMNNQRHYHWVQSSLLCQQEKNDLSINVSNRTWSQLVCFNKN